MKRRKKRSQTIKEKQKKKLKKGAECIFSTSESVLEAIRLCMRLILIALCKRNGVGYILDNEPHVDYLSDLATIEYAYKWLALDPAARQNLHAFCREKFLPQGYESRLVQKETYGTSYNTIYKTLGRFICEDKMILNQAIAEKRIFPHKNKNFDSYNEPNKGKNDNISGYNKLIHFFRLWKLDRYNAGQFLLFQLLFERKVFLGTTSKKDGNNTLKDAYDKYYQIFAELLPEKSKLSDEEYVVTCFMVHELEYTNRFHLCAIVGKYMKDKKLSIDLLNSETREYKLLSERAKFTWSRFAESPSFNTPVTTKGIFEYVSYDILHYQDQISKLLFNTSDSSYDEYKKKHALDVSLVRNMVAILQVIHPLKKMPSWSPEDYKQMRKFFQFKYPIYQVYSQIPHDNNGNADLGEVNNKKGDTCYVLSSDKEVNR